MPVLPERRARDHADRCRPTPRSPRSTAAYAPPPCRSRRAARREAKDSCTRSAWQMTNAADVKASTASGARRRHVMHSVPASESATAATGTAGVRRDQRLAGQQQRQKPIENQRACQNPPQRATGQGSRSALCQPRFRQASCGQRMATRELDAAARPIRLSRRQPALVPTTIITFPVPAPFNHAKSNRHGQHPPRNPPRQHCILEVARRPIRALGARP